MSRKRRDRGADANISFDIDFETEAVEASEQPLTATDIANEGYGSQVGTGDFFADVSREKIVRKPIDEISPNPMQPRRAVPSALRHYWNGQPDFESMARFFEWWLDEIKTERGGDFPLDVYLEGGTSERTQPIEGEADLQKIGSGHKPGAKEAALLKVVELAASIKRDGLTNPVSLSQRGRSYEIETGERRWLAYHLLHWYSQNYPQRHEEDWTKIPARLVDTVSIWRQASENNARADLNAVGKARQFALLLMDLLASEKGEKFRPFARFEQEQDFYAQVADGNNYRVPRGTGEQLINAMGLSDPGQLRHYRRLLRLPVVIWLLADDLNWSESFIQKEILTLPDDEAMIRRAIQEARSVGYTVSAITVYEHLLEEEAPAPKPVFNYSIFREKLIPKLNKAIRKLDGKEREKAIAHLRELLQEYD